MRLEPKIDFQISSMILVIGVCLDEVTTFICLQTGMCYESNPLVFNLISRGLWTCVDFLLVLLCSAIPFLFSKLIDSRYSRAFIIVPVIPGAIRMAVGVLNLALLFSLA